MGSIFIKDINTIRSQILQPLAFTCFWQWFVVVFYLGAFFYDAEVVLFTVSAFAYGKSGCSSPYEG